MRALTDLRYGLFAAALLATGATAQVVPGNPIDPLSIADDDFARHRRPAEWQGLSVRPIIFAENGVTWRVWRIANLRRPRGPLWFVPHDNENAAFDAALELVRSWGGVAIVVDVDPFGASYDARFNRSSGEPIDPNRNFYDAFPLYSTTLLADLAGGRGPIVALHTNAAGYDSTLSLCGPRGDTGSGEISVLFCDATRSPRRAVAPRWPFDDTDTLAVSPALAGADPRASFCAKRLIALDFNLVFERVGSSDGSLSNYAALHGLDYVNLETRDRGLDPAGLAAARDRLVAMADAVMRECVAIPVVRLDPASKAPRHRPRR
jgi:hypothetical protein